MPFDIDLWHLALDSALLRVGVGCSPSGTHDAYEARCREPELAATLGSAQFARIDTVDPAGEVIDSMPTIPDVAAAGGLSV